ncbi:MAG: ankyrin repeat domain-containing protein [Methylococcales bacterium]
MYKSIILIICTLLTLLPINASFSANVTAASTWDREFTSAIYKNNNWEYVKKRLKEDIDINSKDKGAPLIHVVFNRMNRRGNLEEKLRYLINNGADIHATDSGGRNLLHKTVVYSKLNELTKYLISNKININVIDQFGNTPLMNSLTYQNYTAFDLLLNNDADVKSSKGILHKSATASRHIIRLDVLDKLIQKGADIKYKGKYNNTFLHLLAHKISDDDYLKYLKLSVKSGLDINVKNSDGETILISLLGNSKYKKSIDYLLLNSADATVVSKKNSAITAILRGSTFNTNLIDRLISNGANPDAKPSSGVTALHLLSGKNSKDARIYIAKLIKLGASVNVFDDKGKTPLIIASNDTNVETVKLLLKLGAKVNYYDNDNESHTLYKSNCSSYNNSRITEHKEIMKLLISAGADINSNESGDTFLSRCLSNNRRAPLDHDWIEFLLKNNANTNVYKSKHNIGSVYELVLSYKDPELMNLLKKYGMYTNEEASTKLLEYFSAIKQGDSSAVIQIIDNGFYVNNMCYRILKTSTPLFCRGQSPLLTAILNKQYHIVDLLLSKGAYPREKQLIIAASHRGEISIVEKLISHGATSSIEALIASVSVNNLQMTKFLIANGASMENDYKSALQVAIKNNNLSMLDFLISNGADINWIDNRRKSILEFAYDQNNAKAAGVLLKHGAYLHEKFYLNSSGKQLSDKVLAKRAIKYNDIKMLKKLSDKGFKFTLNYELKGAFKFAASLGHGEIIEYIQNTTEIDLSINEPIISIMKGSLLDDIHKFNTDDLSKLDIWGRGALYYAILLQDQEAYLELVKHKEKYKKSKPANSAIAAAILHSPSFLEIIIRDRLYSQEELDYALYASVKKNSTNLVRTLLGSGARLGARKKGRQPSEIYIATTNANYDLIKLLLNYDVDPTQGFSARARYTSSIGYAIAKKMYDAALDMVIYSNEHIKNPKYGTALYFALHNGKYDLLELMLEKDKSGLDPLFHDAIIRLDYTAVVLLLKNNANPLSKNKKDISALNTLSSKKKKLSKFTDPQSLNDMMLVDKLIALITQKT